MFITRFDDTRLYIVYLRLVPFLYVHNADLSIGVHFRCRNTVQYSALTVTLNIISYIINECNAVMCNCLLCCGDTNRQYRVCVCVDFEAEKKIILFELAVPPTECLAVVT